MKRLTGRLLHDTTTLIKIIKLAIENDQEKEFKKYFVIPNDIKKEALTWLQSEESRHVNVCQYENHHETYYTINYNSREWTVVYKDNSLTCICSNWLKHGFCIHGLVVSSRYMLKVPGYTNVMVVQSVSKRGRKKLKGGRPSHVGPPLAME